MPRYFFLLFFSLLFFSLTAQHQTDPAVAAQINQQVWRPFQQAYNQSDGPAMVALHTDDVLRVTPWGIQLGEAYKNKTLERYGQANRAKRQIDFRFEHRIHEGDTGYEVGYYQVLVEQADGSQKASYGRFHIVLKKVDGVWKIAQDWDSSNINGTKVGVEDFNRLEAWE